MSSQAKLQATRYRYLCLLVVGLFMAPALAAPIGAQVIVQAFDPRNPDAQNIQTPYDSGSAVSDAVMDAWGKLRNFVCGPLKQHMGKGNLLANGVTLYNIDCTLPDGELIASQNGGRGLKLAYRVKGVSLAATSTTPDIALGIGLGSYADPRFSASFDLDFELGLALQETGDVLHVSAAKVAVSGARIDSHNASGDMLKWLDDNLVPIVKGQSFRAQAEAALNGINPDFANKVNTGLAPVNNALRPPQNLIRSGLWARPGKIYIAFAPAEWVPPTNSQVSGRVSWKSADINGSVDSCAAFPMSAGVQTGPAPLTDPVTRATGPAPTRTVGQVVSASPVTAMGDNMECRYTLAALPGSVPVGISAKAPVGLKPKYGSNTFFKGTAPILVAPGWGGRTVPDGGSGRDWEMASGLRANSVPTVDLNPPRKKIIDPVINQAINPTLNPALSTNRKLESKTLQTPAAAQMLNPQPLPPKSKLMQPATSQGIVIQPGAAAEKATVKALQTPAAATQFKAAPMQQKQLAQ